MPPQDAIVLDNWFPGTKSVDVRGGALLQSSGLNSVGESLIPYQNKQLFAAAGGNIYDVSYW